MTNETIKQDFESALIKHLSFKAKLRSFLYGNTNQEELLRDPDQCGLGQWIAERRHGAYAQVPQMRELDQLHRRIHQAANLLLDQYQAGHESQARGGFPAVQRIADEIVDVLQAAENHLRLANSNQLSV